MSTENKDPIPSPFMGAPQDPLGVTTHKMLKSFSEVIRALFGGKDFTLAFFVYYKAKDGNGEAAACIAGNTPTLHKEMLQVIHDFSCAQVDNNPPS